MNLLVNLSKFKLLLNKEDRKYLNIILIYQFLGSLLEAFGIALILPLLSIFLNQENQFTNFYSNLFGLENDCNNSSPFLISLVATNSEYPSCILHVALKLLLSFGMVLGRLEYLAFLIIFAPKFWIK